MFSTLLYSSLFSKKCSLSVTGQARSKLPISGKKLDIRSDSTFPKFDKHVFLFHVLFQPLSCEELLVSLYEVSVNLLSVLSTNKSDFTPLISGLL